MSVAIKWWGCTLWRLRLRFVAELGRIRLTWEADLRSAGSPASAAKAAFMFGIDAFLLSSPTLSRLRGDLSSLCDSFSPECSIWLLIAQSSATVSSECGRG